MTISLACVVRGVLPVVAFVPVLNVDAVLSSGVADVPVTSSTVIATDVVPLIVTVTLVTLAAFGRYQISSSDWIFWLFSAAGGAVHTLVPEELVMPETGVNGVAVRLRTTTTRRSPVPVEPLVSVAVSVLLPVVPMAAPKLLATPSEAVAAVSWKFCVSVPPGSTTTGKVSGLKPVMEAVIW